MKNCSFIILFILFYLCTAEVLAAVKVLRNGFVPLAVYADGKQETRLEVELDTGEKPPNSVYVITLTELLVDGALSNMVLLLDDGTYGDRIAGDHVYTHGGIRIPEDFLLKYPLKDRDRRVDTIQFLQNLNVPTAGSGTVESIPFDSNSGPTLGVVDPNYRVAIYPVASDIRMSDRVVNLQVDSSFSDSFLQPGLVLAENSLYNRALRRFYEVFRDDYDFIFILPQSSVPGAAADFTLIANEARGVGLEVGINSAGQVGSAGRLQGVARVPLEPQGPFLQMMMRQWGVYLDPKFGFGEPIYAGSWGLSGVNGILGGFDPATLRNNGNGTVDVDFFQPAGSGDSKPYSPLELYLAGMLPPEFVSPVPVIRNGVIEARGRAFTIRIGSLETVTIDQIIAAHGPRIPAYLTAQKDFRAAFIALSTHPFEESEFAYFHVIAEHMTQRDSSTEETFFQATQGEGTLDTMLGEFKDPALAAIRVPQPTPTPMPGDINADGRLRLDDLVKLAQAWAEGGYRNRRMDLNGDGVTDRKDLLFLLESKSRLP